MTHDRIVGAIGPFEMTEYLGLLAIYGSLALTWRSQDRLERRDSVVAAS